jgi:hypothetical protein
VDSTYYEDLRGLLMGLLIELSDRLPALTSGLVTEFIDHDELGLALETMAEMLSLEGSAITVDERDRMIELAATMKMDDRVAGHVALCPKSP